MTAPLYSIVIPTYNSSGTIEKTLDSVLKQSLQNFEVIIVDDLSSDTAALASIIDKNKYHPLNITTYYSDKKLNGAGARNLGIDLSCGKYISFLDADDEWHKDKLLKSAEVIFELESKGIYDFIIYSKVKIYLDGKYIRSFPWEAFQKKAESLPEYIFGCHGFVQTSTIVLSKKHAARIKFNPAFIRHQDYDFCIRAAAHDLVFYMIDEPLTHYHLSSKSSARRKGESTQYSLFWLKEMDSYLTSKDICTYKAFKLPQKMRDDGNRLKAFIYFLFYFIRCSSRIQKYFIKRATEKLSIKLLSRKES